MDPEPCLALPFPSHSGILASATLPHSHTLDPASSHKCIVFKISISDVPPRTTASGSSRFLIHLCPQCLSFHFIKTFDFSFQPLTFLPSGVHFLVFYPSETLPSIASAILLHKSLIPSHAILLYPPPGTTHLHSLRLPSSSLPAHASVRRAEKTTHRFEPYRFMISDSSGSLALSGNHSGFYSQAPLLNSRNKSGEPIFLKCSPTTLFLTEPFSLVHKENGNHKEEVPRPPATSRTKLPAPAPSFPPLTGGPSSCLSPLLPFLRVLRNLALSRIHHVQPPFVLAPSQQHLQALI